MILQTAVKEMKRLQINSREKLLWMVLQLSFRSWRQLRKNIWLTQPDVKVSVGSSGTGGGFKKFIAGDTDLTNASRPVKEEESALLDEKGVKYTELKLAFDGISIVVNKDNDFIDSLTVEELKTVD